MATYTKIEDILNCHAMVGDGVGNLYVAAYHSGSTTITIYKYEIATDTLTDISGATFVGYSYGSGHRGGLTWWSYNDKLYMVCGIYTPTNLVYCFRWDGSQNWTQVDSATWDTVLSANMIIKSSPDRLAYSYKGANGFVRGTADGVAWNADITVHTIYSLYHDASQYDDLLVEYYESGGPSTKVYRNTAGSSWPALSGSDIGVTQDFLGTNDTYSFFRNRTGVNWVTRSTDWGVIRTNIADLDIHDHAPSVFDLTYEVVALLSTGGGNQDQVRFWNPIGLTFDLDGTPNASDRVMQEPCYWAGYLYVLVENDGIYVRDDPIGPVAEEDFEVGAWSPTAMSVSPDDYYVYVGLLDGSSNPVLLQLLSDLSADPIKAYDPGAGSAIGVHCADFNEEWVWIAGEFGGTAKVRVSIDDGATWTTKDPGTWSGVALPIVLGPDWDNLVLVPTDGDDDLFETEDGGLNWATLNNSLPFDVAGMDRLDLNLDEIVMGSDADRGIRYSPNNGVTLHDLSDVAMANVKVSDLIIG
jgi:hypothetical protein